MALQACPDCGHQVSSKAPSCVKCGSPIAVQTIEATGKKWKMMQLFGGLLLVLGFAGVCGGAASSSSGDNPMVVALVVLAGLILLLWGRFGAWWHHA